MEEDMFVNVPSSGKFMSPRPLLCEFLYHVLVEQLSTVAILGFQFGLNHVVVPLSFLRSNQPCFIVMFLFLADQIFYRSYIYRQYFRLRSLASLSS